MGRSRMPDCPKAPGIVLFSAPPSQGAEAANGQKPQGVSGLPFLEVEQGGPHAYGEFIDPDAAGFGCNKMSEFVKGNNQAEKQNRNNAQ